MNHRVAGQDRPTTTAVQDVSPQDETDIVDELEASASPALIDHDLDVDLHEVERPRILVIDDSPTIRAMLVSLLRDEHQVLMAKDGESGLAMAAGRPQPDLILLDVEMPGIDGFEVCRRLKEDEQTKSIPVVFLTSLSNVEHERRGLLLGAADYIAKPISPPIVLARVRNHLALKHQADFLRSRNDFLMAEVDKRTREVTAIQDVTILAMASMAETRDNETGNHIRRTQHYVKALAMLLRNHPRFANQLKSAYIRGLFKSAPLHDIGKVGIPDRILLKPGRLTPDEFEIMKTHTTLGRDAIQHAEQQLGVKVKFLTIAKEIAFSHQEKWDGSGYPLGLQGEEIPLSARLMAVADVYDALISERVYKKGMSHEQAVEIMVEGRGKHFDPDVLDAFLSLQDEFRAIAARYADSGDELSVKQHQIETALAGVGRAVG
jgi:putative two-component system response regulator